MDNRITVTLTAYNMGSEASEADFDSFASFVAWRLDEMTGLDVEVDQFRFAGSGQAHDRIVGVTTDEQEEVIRDALERLWTEWCELPPGRLERMLAGA